MRVGIVDFHPDFTRMARDLIPASDDVVLVGQSTHPHHFRKLNLDLILIHHDPHWIRKFSGVPWIAMPYGSVHQSHVDAWNKTPMFAGVLDMSGLLSAKFPDIKAPVLAFTPFYPDTPTYEQAGTKIISLIQNYANRFPQDYKVALTITPDLYGCPSREVNDIQALADAKWLLHLKGENIFVCNAVSKALACGVPVAMDEDTWRVGHFQALVKDGHNAIVRPRDKMKDALASMTDEEYARIKQTCVEEAFRYKRSFKWCENWWTSYGVAPGRKRGGSC
jgi:hypothetical protein